MSPSRCGILALLLLAAPAWGVELTVYTARNEQLIKPVFDRYTQETGTTVRFLTDKEGPLLARLQEAMPAMGYLPMTPPDSTSPIVTFAARGVGKRLQARFAESGMQATLYPDRIRISPSFHNDADDIERLLKLCA